MTRDRGVPDRRIPKASNQRRTLKQGIPQHSQRHPQPRTEPSAAHVAATAKSNAAKKGRRSAQRAIGSSHLRRIAAFSREFQERFFSDWRVPVAVSLVVTGGVTALSVGFLLKLPAVPNCPSIFWPLASASLRLHCAQLAAGKRTVNDLLEAIKLLNTLPPNNPLYEEASRLIELWAQDILDLGEDAFQNGKLKDAIDMARKVPATSVAHAEVEAKIKSWQQIWSQAETLYRRAEDALRKENWRLASTEAGRLLSVENRFWQTTKYQELTEKIASTREDIIKLAKAKNLLAAGGVKNLQEALKLASEINDKSYIYQAAQAVLAKTGKEMFDLAQNLLDQRDLTGALDIVKQIPSQANLQKEVEDFEILANAQSRLWSGSEADIEAAIADAQRIAAGRPLHGRAQQLIARWQIEKQDVAQLNQARQFAQSSRPEDLQNAIATASQISDSSPRAKEAQQFIDQITSDMQTKQDRPILERAEQIASAGDVASLQQAIDAVSQISSGRALSEEVRRKRREWSRQIQQIQDQEREFAQATQSPSSILTSDSVPAQQAEADAAEQSLQAAQQTASGGTVDAYAQAIRQASGVPTNSPRRAEAEQYMNQLSQQILQAAITQADYDVPGAIASAQKIPPGTEAYTQAQLQIQVWRRSLGL